MARRDPGRDNGRSFDSDVDDDAPWLAPAGTQQRTRVSRRSLFWTALVLLTLAAVASIGLVLLLSKKDGGSTQGYMNAEQAPLITAEPGPYKQPPLDPKGMAVEGQDQTIYAAGEGIDPGSTIDMSALPEQLLPRPGSEAAEAPGPPRNLVPEDVRAPLGGTAPPPAAPAPTFAAPVIKAPPVSAPKPVPAAPPKRPPETAAAPPAGKAGTVQLGAFSSEETANAAWAKLVGGHPGLAAYGKRLTRVESNGKTLWRLRAAGADTAALCAKLKAGGDACTVIE